MDRRTGAVAGSAHAVEAVLAYLEAMGVPDPLISQYLPEQYLRVCRDKLPRTARELMIDQARDPLRPYSAATLRP